ncbi:MAG: hypothetical protein IJC84_02470 [Clostridia bacterium]|nr:hypothetical protein [Clostridia bacterium]
MKTKLLCLFLALLMLSTGLLVGCAGGGEEVKGTGEFTPVTGGDSVDPNEVYDAEVKNLGGHEFRFYVEDYGMEHWKTREVYAEAPTGDKINDAVFQRNSQIAQTYNCTVVEDKYVNVDVAAALRDPLMAGEYVADFIYGTATDMLTLASSKLFVDYATLDNINLDKVWWDKNFVEGVNVGGKYYFLSGSAGISDDLCAWAMCFNKDYVREYRTDLDLYQVVREGKWTVDLLYEIFSNTTRDNDGDGAILTPGTDRFGFIADYQDNFGMIQAGNITLANYSANGDIEIPDQPKPEILDAWSKLRPVLTSPYRLVTDAPRYVREGTAVFASCAVAAVVMKAGQSKVNMGLLPMPKLSESQDKYYNPVYYDMCNVYAIPTTVELATDWQSNGFSSGAEQCAYFLEAFGYYSHVILKPAFYEQVMLKQNATDSESAEMVDAMLENKVYDPVAGYRWGKLVYSFYECGRGEKDAPGSDINYDNLVAVYSSRVRSARKALENYITAINVEDQA